jgi:hypothetical protein
MKRRGFLQFLAGAPTAVVVTAHASKPPKEQYTGQFKVGEIRRFVEDAYDSTPPQSHTQRNFLPAHAGYRAQPELGWRKWDGTQWLPCASDGSRL